MRIVTESPASCANAAVTQNLHHREAHPTRQTCASSSVCYNHYFLQQVREILCTATYNADWPSTCETFCARPTTWTCPTSSSSSRPRLKWASTPCPWPLNSPKSFARLPARLPRRLLP